MALKNNLTDRELAKFIEIDGEHAVRVSSSNFILEVAKGNIPGHSLIKKFGAHMGLSTSYEPVSDSGTYQTPSTPTSLEIVSDSTDDAPAGSGALTITVDGIGVGWNLIEEDVIMNGNTPVSLVNDFYRVFRIRVKDSGSYGNATQSSHNSTITLSGVVGSEIWGTIQNESGLGLGSSEIGVYTIPAGHRGYIIDMHLDVESTKVVDVIGFKRESADIVTAPYSPMTAFFIKRGIDGDYFVTASPSVSLLGPCDIGFMAKQTGGGPGNPKVEVEFTILIVKE